MSCEMSVRASDADRDQIASALREHLAAGRLDTEEFEERLDRAYSAKTLGDLEGLMADLPAARSGPPSGSSPARAATLALPGGGLDRCAPTR